MEPLRLFQWVRLLNQQSTTPVTYIAALKAVIADELPAQNIRGRWYLHENDIPQARKYFESRGRMAA